MFQNIHGFIGSDYNLVKHCCLQGLSQYLIESKRIKWKFREKKKKKKGRRSKKWNLHCRDINITITLCVPHFGGSSLCIKEINSVWITWAAMSWTSWRVGVSFYLVSGTNDPTWLMMMMSWCLMSSDVIWHIRDKLWPMPKHGSIKATYVRCMRV